MSQKGTILLVLVAFLFNALGYLNVYQFMSIKKSIDHTKYLKDQPVLKIGTAQGKAELLKQGFKIIAKGEYMRHGKLYDVVQTEQKCDSTIIYLAHDSYEEELLTFLKSFFVSFSVNHEASTDTKLKHDILKQYLIIANFFTVMRLNDEYIRRLTTIGLSSTPYFEVVIPPPQLN